MGSEGRREIMLHGGATSRRQRNQWTRVSSPCMRVCTCMCVNVCVVSKGAGRRAGCECSTGRMHFHRSDKHQPAEGLCQYHSVKDLFTWGWRRVGGGGIAAAEPSRAEPSRAEPSRAEGDEMNIYSQQRTRKFAASTHCPT